MIRRQGGRLPDAEMKGCGTRTSRNTDAEFIRRYYPRDAVIVNDLGAVTYYTERGSGLVGLGDIEPLVIMRRTPTRAAMSWHGRRGTSLDPIIQLN